MKKIFTIFALLCALIPARAQYESFFGGEMWGYTIDYFEPVCCTNEYDPEAFPFCNSTHIYSFNHGEIVQIGEDNYYKEEFHAPVFLREDTINGRLYARYSANETDDEYLLCDLSLSVGDTFVLPDGSANWGFYGDRIMVVDSVGYPSGKKVIYLSSCNYNSEIFYSSTYYSPTDFNISLRFMEGVGPIYGVDQPYVFAPQYLGLLLCLFKDDSLYYMTHETLGCYQSNAEVPLYPESSLQIYPNPTDDVLYVELSGAGIQSVELYDLQGRVVETHGRASLPGVATVNVRNVPAGVYVLRVTDVNGREYHQKVVVK